MQTMIAPLTQEVNASMQTQAQKGAVQIQAVMQTAKQT